ncbi:MAG TPA: hypothetical protein HA263_08110 [Methanoregulaceae archaeon]|nr:hypothetical protein [Methanoregulaceae archaeon]
MVTCPKCDYSWPTKATAAWITCPKCQRKFERPDQIIEILGPIALAKPTTCQQCGRERSDLRACYVDDEAAIICAECLKDLLE